MENLYRETQFNEVLGITNGIFSLWVIWKELHITKPCYNEHFFQSPNPSWYIKVSLWNDYLAVRQETRELTRDFFLIHDISLEVYKLLKTTLRPPAFRIQIYDHNKQTVRTAQWEVSKILFWPD